MHFIQRGQASAPRLPRLGSTAQLAASIRACLVPFSGTPTSDQSPPLEGKATPTEQTWCDKPVDDTCCTLCLSPSPSCEDGFAHFKKGVGQERWSKLAHITELLSCRTSTQSKFCSLFPTQSLHYDSPQVFYTYLLPHCTRQPR